VPPRPAPARLYPLELGERTERIKSGAVKPEQDNMLKVSSDGRKAALDVSLVLASDPNGPMPKVDKLVETVAAIHRMSTPMRGTQLVFCDMATPKARKAREAEVSEDDDLLTGEEASLTTDIYAQIKRRLARRGIPEAEIAFAHDAKSTEQKTALYKAINEGRKRVVIASTEKMGVGVNVQERLLAVHHLTPTWRPDGLRQRTGRMERPGNRYGEVFEFVYVTPGSFDGYSWQNLEAKLGFIKDLERGLIQREADDIGDDVVSYATIKAMSSGNPLMLKKVELDSQMHRLEALRREWLRARTGMAREKGYIEKRIPETEASIRFLEADLAQREQTGKEFSVTIGDVAYTERETAGKALRQAAQMHREAAIIGAYRGLSLVGMTRHVMGQLGLEPEQVIGLALSNGDILEANSEVTDKGLFASLDAALRSLDKKLEQARSISSACRLTCFRWKAKSGKPGSMTRPTKRRRLNWLPSTPNSTAGRVSSPKGRMAKTRTSTCPSWTTTTVGSTSSRPPWPASTRCTSSPSRWNCPNLPSRLRRRLSSRPANRLPAARPSWISCKPWPALPNPWRRCPCLVRWFR
jgi:hypothetical protein